ncbi:MAG: hypothetical protein HRT89_22610, partial [Lentisphaeria bacterium]|nr:hypothetical protein [Lentisphaeria bacterium]
ELLIDDKVVGLYTHEQLQNGVNLAGNTKTPQHQQAVTAMQYSKKRAHKAKPLRIFAALEHDVLRKQGVDLSDMNAVKTAMDAAIEKAKKKKSWQHGYFIKLSQAYYRLKPKQKELEKELLQMNQKLFKLCQPVKHRYLLRLKK